MPPARASARPVSPGRPRAAPADPALELQRLAGNRAVAELLASAGPALAQRDVDRFVKGTAAGKATTGSLGTTAGGRPITAHFAPGTSTEKALVIGGVHGSEVSGVAVADELVKRLSAPGARQPFFSVVIVPQLFPDSVAARREWEAKQAGPMSPAAYGKARDKAGDPGRIPPGQEDPNRQMPARGTDFDPAKPVDARGRAMAAENQALLELIKRFSPSRIASLHAIKNVNDAGIYADPHPSVTGPGAGDPALAAEADALALDLAREAAKRGASVPGNKLGSKGETSLYPGQNPKTSADQIAKEDKKGVSLGQWAPSRGISVITVELPGQWDTASPVTDPGRAMEIEARAAALDEIFLGPPPAARARAAVGAAIAKVAAMTGLPVTVITAIVDALVAAGTAPNAGPPSGGGTTEP